MLLVAAACGDRGRDGRAFPVPGDRGPHIVVEVLNASGRPGLARAGALTLRRAGIDVVYFGNAATDGAGPLDSTRIVVRRGDTEVGERIRTALKRGRISVAVDSSRLLDVSVFLGRDFTPPFQLNP